MKLPVNYNTITPRERRKVRLQYMSLQGGKCYHCGNKLFENPSNEINKKVIDYSLFPITMFDYPVHLHHDHKTGMTIGAVHCRCNAVLWQYHGE